MSRVLFVAIDRGAEPLALRLADGIQVDWVYDAYGACEKARGGARFDLVVLDVNGFEAGVFEERAILDLRRHVPGLPLLALVPSRHEGMAALARGAHAFVVKGRLDRESFLDAAFTAASVHRLREELDALGERLVHVDRLASLGQLTAGVAHEINNPAASLLANLTAMKEQIAGASEAGAARDVAALLREWADILDDSVAGVGHICSIVRDLRNFARIDGDSGDVADLGEVIETACKLTEALVRRRARLVKRVLPVPTVKGEHGKLVQVFTNLLTNAAQAIDGPAEDNEIRVVAEERDGMVVAAIEDTGCGIPDAIRTLVFEPFFTTKPKDVGTGLGLALSAEIVHRYGGDIGFASLSRGTRFEVRLRPGGRPGFSVIASERSAGARRSPIARGRVLLVDDEPSLLRAFRRVLAPLHDVVMAASGQQALDILERDTDFDGVICDFTMPDVDGIRIYEVVARRDRELAERIVFCTGGPVSHRGRAFIETTSNTVLEKPVPPDLLLGAIEQLGKR